MYKRCAVRQWFGLDYEWRHAMEESWDTGSVPVSPALGHQQASIWQVEHEINGCIRSSQPQDYLMVVKYDAWPAEFEPPYK